MNVLVTVNNRAKFISLKKKKKKLENKLNSFVFCFHNYFEEYRKKEKEKSQKS